MHAIGGSEGRGYRRGSIRGLLLSGGFLVVSAAIGAVLLATASARAQEVPVPNGAQNAPDDAEPIRLEEIEQRRDALVEELVANEHAIAAARDSTTQAHLEAVGEALRGLDALLRQQAELAKAVTGPAASPSILPENAPPSPLALDQLYEAQFASQQEKLRRADALAASRDALATAKEKLDRAERERREARSAFEAAVAGPAKASAERTLEIRQLASRTAQERVHLRTLETRAAQRVHETTGGSDAELAKRITQLRAALARGEGKPNAGSAALSEREGEVRRSREAIERELSKAELRLDAAQNRFSRQADPPAELLEEVEALTVERDAIRQQIALIDAKLERLAAQRTTWRQWEAMLLDQASREEIESWKAVGAERIEELEQAESQWRGQAAYLEQQLAALQSRLLTPPEDARNRALLEEQREMLTGLLAAERSEVAELAHDRRFSERFLAELRDRTGEMDLLGYAVKGVRSVRDIWRYEITSVDDAPISVGSLILALLLAGLGIWCSRRGSALVGRAAMSRLKLDEGAAHALETLSFYALLVAFTLLALRAVHFPLTAFTVLGGALAIGIGFGSQNVMNNFISGLIIMLERPIRARDVVEIDGNPGTIEKIGARSTQIRSTNGRHIIVPNSFFLESNVINWTLSDELIRTRVLVGVTYGSPTRLVEELIRRVVTEDEWIIKDPEPIILLEEFGDNSLNFEVHFWVTARAPMEVRKIQSRVRFRIDDLFREHDLVIAFPQRDVHLDSARPIEVRVLSNGASSEPPRVSEQPD